MIRRFWTFLKASPANGTEFVNSQRETLQQLNIIHVTSFHITLRSSKITTLRDCLSKQVQNKTGAWDICLSQTLAAVRFKVSDSTTFSPFYLLYNRDGTLPIDNLLKPRRKYLGDEFHQMVSSLSLCCIGVSRSTNKNKLKVPTRNMKVHQVRWQFVIPYTVNYIKGNTKFKIDRQP